MAVYGFCELSRRDRELVLETYSDVYNSVFEALDSTEEFGGNDAGKVAQAAANAARDAMVAILLNPQAVAGIGGAS